MREYVYAGDWGNVRFQAAAARSEGYRVLEHLLGTWKPGATFSDRATTAAARIVIAADDWDLAATFGTLGAATDAAASGLDASKAANVALDRFMALSRKYHFDCSDITYP